MLNSFVRHNINILVDKWISYVENDPDFYKSDESYKYKAVETFQKHFDLDAKNVCEMLKNSTKDSANLIQSGSYYPLKMLLQFCEKDSEFVRAQLKYLYDENIPVRERMDNVIETLDKRFVTGDFNSYFDYRFFSFFLAARHPKRYIEVKYRESKDFADIIGYKVSIIGSPGERYVELQKLAQDVRNVLSQNEAYLEMHKKLTGPFDYKDRSLSWGTTDFIFNTARRIKDPFGEDAKIDIEEDKKIMEMKEDEMEDMIGSRKNYKEVGKTDVQELLKEVKQFQKPSSGYIKKEGTYKVRVDNQRQKEIVKKIENYSCQVCGFEMKYRSQNGSIRKHIHADHIHDKRGGGSEEADNLWVLCPNCHAKKTLGVIVVDKQKGKVFENEKEIKLHHNSHLSWYK